MDTVSVLILPYNYTYSPKIRTYINIATKANITPSSSNWDLTKSGTGASTADLGADGFTYGGSEDKIYYTFYHTFKIPLNVIN